MKKVMVIDDDKEFLDEITETLKSRGYQVTPVSEVDLAIEKAHEIMPDVILLDIKMEKSGLKVADKLRRFSKTKDIPIVAITGVYTEESHRIIMKTFGINTCLIKPLNMDEVIEVIEKENKRK